MSKQKIRLRKKYRIVYTKRVFLSNSVSINIRYENTKALKNGESYIINDSMDIIRIVAFKETPDKNFNVNIEWEEF